MGTIPRFTISGKIMNRFTRQAIPNLKIEAWDKDFIFHDFLGKTSTDSDGVFRLEFTSAYFDKIGLDKYPDVFFRIFDDGRLLKNTIHDVNCNLEPGNHFIRIYLDIPAEDGTPVPQAPLTSGALTDPEVLFNFKRSLSSILAGFGLRNSAERIKALRIPFEGVSDLLDLASAAVSGNQQEMQRLRELLWSYGGKAIPSSLGLTVLRQFNNGRYVGESISHKKRKTKAVPFSQGISPGLINPFRLEKLMVAAALSARDSRELATLAAGIEHALVGADQLNTLYQLVLSQAAPVDIANAFDTAVRISSFSFPSFNGFTPGEGGSSGFGFGSWFGVPWYEWPFPIPGEPFPNTPAPEVPTPEIPRFDGGLTEHFEECFIHTIIPELHHLGIGFRDLVYGVGTNYVIENVSPDHGCPGTTITIEGERFDGVVAVRYYDNSGRTISTDPLSATSTRITFILDENAVSGPIWLYIPKQVRLCLTEHTVALPGVRGELLVGQPHIISFTSDRSCWPLGEALALDWRVSPANTSVQVRHRFGASSNILGSDLGAVDEISYTPSAIGTHEFELVATNPAATTCDTASRTISLEVKDPAAPPFEIVGVEKTQAIQVYDLTNPTDPANNSLELISGMDTILRVYVRALSPALTRLTGSLELNGISYAPINADSAGPNPIIEARRFPSRARINHSLNFLIPAADATGLGVNALIKLVNATDPCNNPVRYRAEIMDWHDRTPFPVTVRIVANSNGTQMSLATSTTFINRVFSRLPSPKTAIAFHPGVHQIQAGTTEDNYCRDGGFYQLALSIAYEHNDNEGYPPASHSSSWIGLVTPFDCTPDGIMAWPSTSTCLSIQNVGTAAHEIMHTVGLGHTITGAGEGCWEGPALTGGADTQPVSCHRLPGRPLGALIQIPFDIVSNQLVTGAFDLMSYRGTSANNWLSPELWVEGRTIMNSRY